MNKHKIFLILLFFNVPTLFFQADNSLRAQETTPADETLLVSLNEVFVLHKNQAAIVKEEDLQITIRDFMYAPCPEGVVCIWSGLGIVFEYRHKNEIKKGVNLTNAFGYEIDILETDYQTYATLKVSQ